MSYGKSIDFLFNQMRSYAGSLAAGSITFYEAGTTTLATVYLDRTLSQAAANPYMLSADGTAELFASGLFRVVIKDAAGVTIYDYDNVEFISSVSTATADGSTFTEVDASSGDALYTLTTDYNQYIGKSGDNTFTVTVSPPIGYSFADGISTYVLYSDREVVQFIRSGNVFYVVV